ncbi:serine protease [Kitasatospora sp. GP82]|uniref:trypsin-like serine peptidase n=1 Tax=Kitasatospora sp. GP82 TaxID=3035089 RepID=UPI00247663DD|nr:serine protease [Kitasatospora sp. GP82]MDH6123379.1 V8-like Glu-specific endopeptidase [Kitasatospora sp. GP82]
MNRRPLALTTLLVLVLGTAAAIAGATSLTSETTAFGHRILADPSHSAAPRAAAPAARTPSASASSSPDKSATPAAAGTPSASASASSPDPSASASASASPSAPDTPSASADSQDDVSSLGPAPGTTTVAPISDESSRVGALYSGSAPAGNHFCSASVVHSNSKNLLLTAAHCVGNTDNLYFAPGYRDGKTPFGTWQVTKLYNTSGWSQNGSVDEDFAILQVAQNNGRDIEDVVGANTIGLGTDFGVQVRLYGYPANTEEPILCTNATTRQDDHQRRINCPSFPGGTSGGPWIDTDTNEVIGVIGGYQQGGDTDDISYSATFDQQTIGALYQRAVADNS